MGDEGRPAESCEDLERLVEERTKELAETTERLRRERKEREQREQALRQAEENFAAFVRDSAYGYLEMDLDGNITFVNERAAEIVGYAAGEVVGLNFRDFVAPEDLERALSDLAKVATEPNAGPREYAIRRKDGSLIHMDVNTLPLRKGGRIVGYQITATDLTDRKRTEEALRESREELRHIIDNAWDIIFRIDLEGNYTFVNKAAERLTGYSGKELLSMNMRQLIAPEHQQLVLGRLKKRMAGEPLEQPFDFEIVTKAGQKIVVELTTTGIRDKDGKLAGVQGIARDATERKRAEEALRESEKKYRQLVETVDDVIYEVDSTGVITYMSPSVEKLSGWKPSELIGQPFLGFIHEEEHPRVLKLFRARLAGHTNPDEYRVKIKSGEVRWVRAFSRRIAGEDASAGVRGVMVDITERKRAEEALRESEELHRTMLNALPEAVTKSDLEGRVTYASPRSVELYGCESADELIGKNAIMLIAPEDRERAMANLRRTFKEGILRDVEYALLRKNGTRYPAEMSAAVVLGADGKPREFVSITRDLSERKEAERKLREAEERRDELAAEIAVLRTEMQDKYGFGNIIAQDPAMRAIFDKILAVAPTRASVLIQGETGTGKELVAKAIHYNSPRRDRPFVKVDCGALAETLLESELFGHVKGAFTGAMRDRRGRFEMADGGTIFLDEIHSTSPSLQAKLLRAVQEARFEKVGSAVTQEVDIRIIAATNEDLEQLVEENRFREDLYYRLNVVPVRLPPLRERMDDVPLLAQSFIRRFAERHGRDATSMSGEALAELMNHDWPGNVRELENIVEQAVVLCAGDTIGRDEIRLPVKARIVRALPPAGSLKEAADDFERQMLEQALKRAGGNRMRAAKFLEISRSTLYQKLKRHALLERRW